MAAIVPDFLIIGAMKAATTSLYDLLATSPQFNLPLEKEPGLLRPDHTPGRILADYARHFGNRPGLRGDASTTYAKLPVCPDVSGLARRVIGPDLRIVLMTRDRHARLISHLRHNLLVGHLETTDFDAVVRDDPQYLAFGDYERQLRPWVEAFGRQQVHLCRFEDLAADPMPVGADLCRFLGADPALLQQPQRASNVADSLYVSPRYGRLGWLTGSGFYRRVIRPLLPARLHSRAKAAMLDRRAMPDIRFSEATRLWLEDQYAGQEARMQRFLSDAG